MVNNSKIVRYEKKIKRDDGDEIAKAGAYG